MSPLRHLLMPALIASTAPMLAAAAPDPGASLPTAVTTRLDSAAAMTKMETAVKPEVLDAFKQQHPAPFWLFGEDRQLAIRNAIIPAHWFDEGARQFQQFCGVARPGEFYVFQVGLVPGAKTPKIACDVAFKSLPGAVARIVAPESAGSGLNPVGAVVPIWASVQIPANAPLGVYHGEVTFHDPRPPQGEASYSAAFAARVSFSIRVEGAPIGEGGTEDAWRLARLKWLDSTIGTSATEVTRPFTPIKVDPKARTLDILGRRITLGDNGIPAQFTSYVSGSNTTILAGGRDAFSEPPQLQCLVAGKAVDLIMEGIKFKKQSPEAVEWVASSRGADLFLSVHGRLEYDGCLQLRMLLQDDGGNLVKVDDVRFITRWNKDVAKYAMGLGLQGGLCPDRHDWKWDVAKHQDAIWMGDVNIGVMMRFKDSSNYRRPLINAYYDFRPLVLPESWGSGGILIENSNHSATLTTHSGPKRVRRYYADSSVFDFDIDWYFTPFKPIDVKQHFTDRYYHPKQGATLEDTAALKKAGVNIVEIHHNQLSNPYINYPYNSDSFPHLQHFVKTAHGDGLRVNLYYTTRELTQNLPEFFALKSMAGEIILPRKEGVAWPVTNPGGPHPWLKQHAGMDIVPAWREDLKFPQYQQKLDLAVITTPDSRWNNFYLEGLDYLVRKAGIDGLYIDDTALDRKSMQRARRILDADGNTGRRVNMHSWNHFNGLAKWSNSSIAFMELYPYYDGLWHGEGFNANASPEYMLVEMSGIPYGLMSEMLDHPNPWHGMVFGMRTRWPWSGDPRPIWQLEDQFGIADADYTGWWDPACPVQTGSPQVKASVYRKQGKTLIALASWAPAITEVRLAINWAVLGLAEDKTMLRAPECKGLQSERMFTPGSAIPVEPNKGWLLIADEIPRG